MNNSYLFIFLYLVFAVCFNQFYKIATFKMNNSVSLTILLEIISGLVAMLFIPFFPLNLPNQILVYIFLLLSSICYAIHDRLSTIVRDELSTSNYIIIRQLSTVLMFVFGIWILNEKIITNRLIGALLILLSNILVLFENKKIKFDKAIIMGVIANLCMTTALIIDVKTSLNFNLAFYISLTLLVPALINFVFSKRKMKDIKTELVKGNKTAIIITSISWVLMTLTKLKAYELGNVTVIAPLCSLTVIINVLLGYFYYHEKANILKKIIASIIIIIGVLLIK